MSDWQPIETAPKKFMQLGDAGDGCWHTGWMVCGRFGDHGWVSWVGMLDADSWLGRDDTHCCFDTDPPTHWMPLPPPPTQSEEP